MSLPGIDDWIQGAHICPHCKANPCRCEGSEAPEVLDRIADRVLAYRPKPKTKAAKRRARRKARQQRNR